MTATFKTEQGNLYLYSADLVPVVTPKFLGITSDLNKVMKDSERRVILTAKPDYASFWNSLLGLKTKEVHKETKREITTNEVSTFSNGVKVAKQTYSTLLF